MLGGFATNEWVDCQSSDAGTPESPYFLRPSRWPQMTVLVVVQVTTSAGFNVHNIFQVKGAATTNNGCRLIWYNNNGLPRWEFSRDYTTTDVQAASSNGSAPTSGTHTVVAVDRGVGLTPRMYQAPLYQWLDEVAYQTQTAGAGTLVADDESPLRIGNNLDGTRPYHSNILVLSLWDRALSYTEVLQAGLDPKRAADQVLHAVFDDALRTEAQNARIVGGDRSVRPRRPRTSLSMKIVGGSLTFIEGVVLRSLTHVPVPRRTLSLPPEGVSWLPRQQVVRGRSYTAISSGMSPPQSG
jgi:hypothetical protein